MAMINQGAWNGQDQPMSSGGDDEFHQFFDIGMSGMGDSMQFDFQDFGSPNGQNIIQQHQRDTVDTPMSNTNGSSIMSQNNMRVQSHPMTSAQSVSTIASHIIPSQHAQSNSISEIDAQIQFLQHQRLQQQQRQLEEQRRRLEEQQAAFYAQQHRNMVPSTLR